MSRPRKYRKVCYFPQTLTFTPENSQKRDAVILSVDEYEAIRLIDRETLSQEQCGIQMGISRTTVQMIYAAARKKIAAALVEGRPLHITGGEYQLCNGAAEAYGCCGCFKHHINRQYKKQKGESAMRIAVTFENDQIFQHFGHTEQFKIYDVEGGKIVSSQVMDTNGQGHGALAGVLKALGVDTLICGGIGGGARTALEANSIQLYGGVSGSADAAVTALLEGKLSYDPEVRCSHHDHGEGHDCGHHNHKGCHGAQSCHA
ncbi:MAG: DUF134 domain-containing protein [Oscillospiraceae bacterium]|nr:DUF134 domain-containing protein [Oscillospiraceae bacterium]